MLETVDVGRQYADLYESSAGAEAVAHLRELAEPLRGARVLHLNATPYGGGVAEILRSESPLLRDLGIAADWKLITGDEPFFSVTKAIHNGLQGAPGGLTGAQQETYLTYSARNAQLLEEEYDLIVAHDPQPLALLQLHGKGAAKWIWRRPTQRPRSHHRRARRQRGAGVVAGQHRRYQAARLLRRARFATRQ